MNDQTVNPDTHASGEGDHQSDADKTVPVSVVEAVRKDLQGKISAAEAESARLRGQVEGLTAAPQTQQETEKVYTRTELTAFVDAGQLTRDEADRILDSQADRRTEQRSRETAAEIVGQATTVATLNTEIARYVAVVPELATAGSDAFKKVDEEYRSLVNITGQPEPGDQTADLRLKLIALRSAYGAVEKLQRATAKDRETHQGGDSGDGGGGDADESAGGSDGPPKGLSREAKKHYGAQIERGMYTDWAAVSKELDGASPSVKARLGV